MVQDIKKWRQIQDQDTWLLFILEWKFFTGKALKSIQNVLWHTLCYI